MSKTTTTVATDVGGTFTDLVCFEIDHGTGRSSVRTAKTATTPPDYERGMMEVLRKGNVELNAVDFLAHGTTVVINALTERKGVKVGLISTEGFRDTLEIARGNRPDHYVKPPPFVPRHLRRELPGRMSYRGEEMRALDLSPLAGILSDFRDEGVEAVAISFLHSYANPSHERAAEECGFGPGFPSSPPTASQGSGASTRGPTPRSCRPTFNPPPNGTFSASVRR